MTVLGNKITTYRGDRGIGGYLMPSPTELGLKRNKRFDDIHNLTTNWVIEHREIG